MLGSAELCFDDVSPRPSRTDSEREGPLPSRHLAGLCRFRRGLLGLGLPKRLRLVGWKFQIHIRVFRK